LADGVAQCPRARGLRGNLTQTAESWVKPDCSRFERNREEGLRAAPGWACAEPYFLEKLMDAR
jgi:hypothetical protein